MTRKPKPPKKSGCQHNHMMLKCHKILGCPPNRWDGEIDLALAECQKKLKEAEWDYASTKQELEREKTEHAGTKRWIREHQCPTPLVEYREKPCEFPHEIMVCFMAFLFISLFGSLWLWRRSSLIPKGYSLESNETTEAGISRVDWRQSYINELKIEQEMFNKYVACIGTPHVKMEDQ